LIDADLTGVDLRRANLKGANLSDADLSNADLSNAVLTRTNLAFSFLSYADLTCANFTEANLTYASLGGAHLAKSNLTNSVFGATTLPDIDLSKAIGLETIKHVGPSSIGLDTFFKSKGKIPIAFLRGAGVPDTFIQYATSLIGASFKFYSCFISHSSKDALFVKRLHADLQDKGVRCWYAPEDLKIGTKFRNEIDEAIRTHEKLLLVLSENSVESDWVEKEVETAFERERKEKRLVLFPICLGDGVKNVSAGWAADIRRTRHMGDFRKWKNAQAYANAFGRLLRDLKSESGK
jgi:TIR domain-containing protein/pentapeptide repeat protein